MSVCLSIALFLCVSLRVCPSVSLSVFAVSVCHRCYLLFHLSKFLVCKLYFNICSLAPHSLPICLSTCACLTSTVCSCLPAYPPDYLLYLHFALFVFFCVFRLVFPLLCVACIPHSPPFHIHTSTPLQCSIVVRPIVTISRAVCFYCSLSLQFTCHF